MTIDTLGAHVSSIDDKLDETRKDVRAIQDQLGGADGIHVQIASIREQLKTTADASKSFHTAAADKLSDNEKKLDQLLTQNSSIYRIQLDPALAKTLVGAVAALIISISLFVAHLAGIDDTAIRALLDRASSPPAPPSGP